ncbi:hypothetical protein TSUD_258510 [Trifolium subterraneum]|uniref:TIR domain-containing protein n=1 Tax=Trifolium subterraneum TaxID=3900 RepID=A0A2Z6P886_TRISU|nr:hypothetical protein TSUD_258510 [Trifolium subterraneum]
MQNGGADAMATKNYKYDVFLSFCKDTRSTFTGNLYHALTQKRIDTVFLGADCWPYSDQKVIQESRMSIVVFSKGYASSPRCLDELVSIIDLMNKNKQRVWPIFFKVDREKKLITNNEGTMFEQFGSLSMGLKLLSCLGLSDSGAKHEFLLGNSEVLGNSERMQQWKVALSDFSTLFGWDYKTNEIGQFSPLNNGGVRYEYELIQKIVKEVVESLPRYDIFLSFCGEDTRHSFTGFLYRALCREGFKTFMDDEHLEGGKEISKTLLDAIEKSRLSIVVFSKNYGYSSWCLDEFVKIIECKNAKSQMVLPIFYKVEQVDVCNQTNSYGDAMTGHEDKYGKDSEKVKKWKSALSEVASLKGEYINKTEYESEVIKRIVKICCDSKSLLECQGST